MEFVTCNCQICEADGSVKKQNFKDVYFDRQKVSAIVPVSEGYETNIILEGGLILRSTKRADEVLDAIRNRMSHI